jgi:hypothetical protein
MRGVPARVVAALRFGGSACDRPLLCSDMIDCEIETTADQRKPSHDHLHRSTNGSNPRPLRGLATTPLDRRDSHHDGPSRAPPRPPTRAPRSRVEGSYADRLGAPDL